MFEIDFSSGKNIAICYIQWSERTFEHMNIYTDILTKYKYLPLVIDLCCLVVSSYRDPLEYVFRLWYKLLLRQHLWFQVGYAEK